MREISYTLKMKRYLFTFLLGFLSFFILIKDSKTFTIQNFFIQREKYFPPLTSMIPSSHYGVRDGQPHWGQDYFANTGTIIYSPCTCSVYSSSNQRLGNYIILTDVKGVNFLFAHLSKNYIYNDSAVEKGREIGETGNSGYSFGAHLHLEVYWGNFYFNPKEIF